LTICGKEEVPKLQEATKGRGIPTKDERQRSKGKELNHCYVDGNGGHGVTKNTPSVPPGGKNGESIKGEGNASN